MPKKMHKALEAQARDKGLTGQEKDAYVYGTLQRYSQGKLDPRSRRARALKKRRK